MSNNRVTELLGCEYPILAFSHCRDVVAAVTNAGGFGVLGAVAHTPERLEIDLTWIEAEVKGKPYGLDVLLPRSTPAPTTAASTATPCVRCSRPRSSSSSRRSSPGTRSRSFRPTSAAGRAEG